MDADFQQRYLSAEQAYGEGNYPQARDLSTTLLDELNAADLAGRSDEVRIAWRAVLSLLLGHIEFHGFQDPAAAEAHYQRVLSCQPPDTLRELAEQGIGRCSPAAKESVKQEEALALIQDPFVCADAATPWLDSPTTSQSRNTPIDALQITPEQKLNPEETSTALTEYDAVIQEAVIQEAVQPEPIALDLSPFLLRLKL